ncbi:MAG: DUF4160 domain-containing protein [Chitinivibrionia bacterium]|nr:DUF4160 domain-containing protein [Chitinivibrionia bacterium]
MPKVLVDYLGLVFYFWANEFGGNKLEPVHIHVSRGKQEENATKIWIKTDGSLEVANNNSKLTQKELSKALEYIETNKNDIIAQWYMFFGARN